MKARAMRAGRRDVYGFSQVRMLVVRYTGATSSIADGAKAERAAAASKAG